MRRSSNSYGALLTESAEWLLNGPGMVLHVAIVFLWLSLFFIHVTRPHRREPLRYGLVAVSLACGLAAVFHRAFHQRIIEKRMQDSEGNPALELVVVRQPQVDTQSLIILATGVVLLIISCWAWRLRRPSE